MSRLLFLLPLALSLIACGPSHEGTVTYQVRLRPGSVIGGTIADSIRVGPEDAQGQRPARHGHDRQLAGVPGAQSR